MCEACTPRKDPITSELIDNNPDLPNGRVLDYKIVISDEVFKLPREEFLGYIARQLDRQWSALYDSAKEEYITYNSGLLDPTEFTKP